MNYTTNDCVCEKPMGSIPVRNAPPPLNQQLACLTEKIGFCADRLNQLSTFLTDTRIEADKIEDRSVSANIAYCVRMLDQFCNKLDFINEFCR